MHFKDNVTMETLIRNHGQAIEGYRFRWLCMTLTTILWSSLVFFRNQIGLCQTWPKIEPWLVTICSSRPSISSS